MRIKQIKPLYLLFICLFIGEMTSGSFPQELTIRAALKVMPPILWCWPMISEADVGAMAVEAEPSHQYSITFCCCVTDGSRGAVWQNGVWHGSAYEAKVCHWIPPCIKNGTHWHSLMLAEHLWRPNNGCQHSEAVGGAFLLTVGTILKNRVL